MKIIPKYSLLLKGLLAVCALGGIVVTTFALAPAAARADGSVSQSRTIVVINRAENVLPSTTGLRHNSPLYNTAGQVVGSDSGTCELLPPRSGIANEFACDAVLTLQNGSVTVYGKQQIPTNFAQSAITGGTGVYEGCEGTITGVPNTATPDPLDIQITLNLKEC